VASVTRANRRPLSLWLVVGPALSTVGVALSLADGRTGGARWLSIVLLVGGVILVVTISAIWWAGRDQPHPPPRQGTSRWAAGRPEERWR
jgi:hypothetical protein